MTAQSSGLSRKGHPPFRRTPAINVPERLFFGVIGFVAVLILWEAEFRLGLIRGALLSSPSRIVAVAITDFGSGAIWPEIGTSLIEWLVGFGLAILVAIPFGFAIGMFRRLQYLVDPLLAALYATPLVALVPLIILVFGVGLSSKFFIVFLFTAIPLTIITISGVQSAERRYLDIARSFQAPRLLVFRSVTIPSTTPYIITGLRLSAGHALVGVVVGEFLASNAGIGFYISFNGSMLDTSRVMLGIVLLGAFGVFTGELIRRVERRFDKWRPAIH